jgi:undecaprenyl-diphosphatase
MPRKTWYDSCITATQAFFLGILQGLTEFLPISSSGHLILAEKFLGIELQPDVLLSINVLLHAGTLLALLVMYRRMWVALFLSVFNGDRVHQKITLLLIIATIPAVLIGVLFEEMISTRFSSVQSVAAGFFVTAFVLWFGERSMRQRRAEHMSWTNSFFIGVAQACALLPGLSRSGLTISAGRAVGLTRQEALDFSFLMAVPVLAGASVLSAIHVAVEKTPLPDTFLLTIGFMTSFTVSMFAIIFLRSFVQRHSLSWFSAYLLCIGIVLLFL